MRWLRWFSIRKDERGATPRGGIIGLGVAASILVAAGVFGSHAGGGGGGGTTTSFGGGGGTTTTVPGGGGGAPLAGTPICGQSVLQPSTFSYVGPGGPYTSGTVGLPTYGSVGTDFPLASSGFVFAPGNHSTTLAANTVYFFRPGTHTTTGGSFSPLANDAFVGGFASGAGAVYDGTTSPTQANGGKIAFGGNTDSAGVFIEYLTITNWVAGNSSDSQAVVNQGLGKQWKIRFNTVSNITGSAPGSSPGQGTGVAVNAPGGGGDVSYNCIDGAPQSGVQQTGGESDGSWFGTVTHNEITHINMNAAIDMPGGIHQCGCGAGVKLVYARTPTTMDDNFIHDSLVPGLWCDTDCNGVEMARNYLSNVGGYGIAYELSYNASITNNTIINQGVYTVPNIGAFSVTPGFRSGDPGALARCGAPCTNTNASGFTYPWAQQSNGADGNGGPAIYINNSGGDSRATPGTSSGTLTISGNVLTDDWGAITLWQDISRVCGQASTVSGSDCTMIGTTATTPWNFHMGQSVCAGLLANVNFNTVVPWPDSTGSLGYNANDLCVWHTWHISVTGNTFNFNTTAINTLTGGTGNAACTAAHNCGVMSQVGDLAGGTHGQVGCFLNGANHYTGNSADTQATGGQSGFECGDTPSLYGMAYNFSNVWANNSYTGPWQWRLYRLDGTLWSWAQWHTAITTQCTGNGCSLNGTTNGFGQDLTASGSTCFVDVPHTTAC